jgi:hypothetical protein
VYDPAFVKCIELLSAISIVTDVTIDIFFHVVIVLYLAVAVDIGGIKTLPSVKF